MRSLLTILFFFAAFSAYSQTTSNYDYLQAYRRFTLAGRSVKGISNDTTMLFGSADSLVTQYALKGYLAGHGIGIKGRQHQLLGAKADSTTDLQYLEPLVEGAFVVSDSELNAATLVPAIYDLRNGQKWVSDNAGNFTKDTSGNTYFTDYGVRRFLYNPTTQKTFYVKPDSSYSQIGSGNVFNVHADTTINNTYVSNDNSYFYNLGDSSYLDSRDFYNDGTITTPYRVRRYDNAYIDSLFASLTPGGGGGGGGGTTVNNYYTNKLPFNGDTTFYLAGDSLLHKLPAYAGLDTTSLSRRIDTKLNITDTAGKWIPIGTKFANPIKLTTKGQNGPATLQNDTLNVPNYFFAVSDSSNIDYSFVSMTTIYNEKGPGEYFASGHGVTVNADNTIHVFRQVKSLDVSGWNTNDYISFKNSLTANATAYTFFRAFIYLKQLVPNEQSITVQFFNNGVAVSKGLSIVNYGLNKNLVGSYMNITVPMSAFNFTSNSFDEIRFIFGGGSSPDGLYLDLVQFQNATEKENAYLTDISRIPGSVEVRKTINGQDVLAYTDSVGAAVDTTSLSKRIDDKLNTADTLNKWMPRNTPIVTAFNGRAGNVLPQSGDYSTSIVAEGTNLYYTDTRSRAALTLTRAGTSGLATYNNVTGELNIPNYSFTPQNLQSVTDLNSTTTNNIVTYNANGKQGVLSPASVYVSNSTGGTFSAEPNYVYTTDGNNITWMQNNGIGFGANGVSNTLLQSLSSAHTQANVLLLPDKSGTLATLDDITGGGGGGTTGTYEPKITSGTTSQYWRGDKTWQDLNAATRTAISVIGGGSYDNTTGVINITGITATNQSAYSVFRNHFPAVNVPTWGYIDSSEFGGVFLAQVADAMRKFQSNWTMPFADDLNSMGKDLGSTVYFANRTSGVGLKAGAGSTGTTRIMANSDGSTYLGLGTKNSIGGSAPHSTATIQGSFSTVVKALTVGSTLSISDNTIFCNTTTAAFNITLPTAAAIAGREYIIKKTDASGNAVTVNTTSSQTIDGALTYSLPAQYKYVHVKSDGANWYIIGNN